MARTSAKTKPSGGGKQAGEDGDVLSLLDALSVRLTQLGKRKWQVSAAWHVWGLCAAWVGQRAPPQTTARHA